MAEQILLVTDLAGTGDIGDDAAEALRRAHFRLIRELAASSGAAARPVGDGLLVAFADASAALAFAASIRSAAARHNRRHGDRALDVRVGLAIGPEIRDDEDYLSAPVVLARRLCEAAQPGSALAAAEIAAAARDTRGMMLTEPAPVAVRGRSAPVRAVAVSWAPAEALSLPAGLAAPDPMVGRLAEAERLAAEWKEALSGAARFVLLAGGPGVGTTRLAAALGGIAHGEGAIVLHGNAERGLDVPHLAMARSLRPYLAACDGAALRAHGDASGRIARTLFGDLDWGSASGDGDVGGLVRDVALEAPVLLVLDDLHDADDATLAAMVAAVDEDAEICVVGTYAPGRVRHASPFARALPVLREAASLRLRVPTLDESEVAEMVSRLCGDDAAGDLARVVFERSGGNPLVVEAMCRDTEERLPQGLLDAVGRAVDRVSPEAAGLVRSVAIAGWDVVERSSSALAEAEDTGLVRHGAPMHEVIRSAVVETMDPWEVRRLHLEAADALRDGPATAALVPGEHQARIERHLREAGEAPPSGPRREPARSAEEEPDRRQHPPLPDPERTARPRATTAPRARVPEGAARHDAVAGPAERRRRATQRLHAILAAFPDRIDVDGARHEVADAEAVDDASVRELAQAVAAAAASASGHPAEAAAHAERATVSPSGDSVTGSVARAILGWSAFESGSVRDAFADFESAWTAADQADNAPAAQLASRASAVAHRRVLDLAGARGSLVREISKARTRKTVAERKILVDALAADEVLFGRRVEAQRLAAQADVDSSPSAPMFAYCDGRFLEAARGWREAIEERDSSGAMPAWEVDRLLASAYRMLGDTDEARDVLETSLVSLARAGVVVGELTMRAELAVLHADRGELREARSHFIRAVEIVSAGEPAGHDQGDEWYGVGGRVDLARALIDLAAGRVESAHERFDAASAALRRHGLPFDEADAHGLWSRALLGAGFKPQAKESLRRAGEVLRGCEAGEPWLRALAGR